MKKQIVTTACIASLWALSFSCTKKDEAKVYQQASLVRVSTTAHATIPEGVKEKPAQVFSGKGNAEILFTGAEGTDVRIPSHALVSADGSPYLGIVRIELIEIFKKSEMILNNAPTMSGGKALISGGEFSIKAYDDAGNPLSIALGRGIVVDVPAPAPDNNMALFTSSSQGADWQLVDASTVTRVTLNDSLQQGTTAPTIEINKLDYRCILKEFTWYNCDYFMRENISTINVSTEAYAPTQLFRAQAYVVYRNKNSVIMVTGDDFKVIQDEPFTLVYVGYDINGQIYYDIKEQPASAKDLSGIKINLTLGTREAFAAALSTKVDS
ncbi:MAG TPA: hypothetical protein VL947_03285 [Cytophagales bacterium]|nr:hypothetical protein [Cytophagales bacterium]